MKVARGLVGTKYVHLGRNAKEGLDCYGLVLAFFSRIGFPLKECTTKYDSDWWKAANHIVDNEADFEKIPIAIPGCVLSLKVGVSSVANHLAVMVDDTYVLNTDELVGAHLLRYFAIKNKIVSHYRYKNLK